MRVSEKKRHLPFFVKFFSILIDKILTTSSSTDIIEPRFELWSKIETKGEEKK